jgi:hypothetical protein
MAESFEIIASVNAQVELSADRNFMSEDRQNLYKTIWLNLGSSLINQNLKMKDCSKTAEETSMVNN